MMGTHGFMWLRHSGCVPHLGSRDSPSVGVSCTGRVEASFAAVLSCHWVVERLKTCAEDGAKFPEEHNVRNICADCVRGVLGKRRSGDVVYNYNLVVSVDIFGPSIGS